MRPISGYPNEQVAFGAASPEGKADEAAFRGGVPARRGGRDLAAAERIALSMLRQARSWIFFLSTLEQEGIRFRLRSMPILIITEKTSQARDLRTALGDRFGQILPAEGHLLRLAEPHEVEPSWKNWACVLLKPYGLYPTKPATEGNKPAKLKAIGAALKRCVRDPRSSADLQGSPVGHQSVSCCCFGSIGDWTAPSANIKSRPKKPGVLIISVPLAYKTRRIDFGNGEKLAMTIPWGDLRRASVSFRGSRRRCTYTAAAFQGCSTIICS